MKDDILRMLPIRIRRYAADTLNQMNDIEEIRVRVGQPLELRGASGCKWMTENVTEEELEEMLTYISRYSMYAFEEEMRQGFLTLQGGHRVGLAGQVRTEDGSIMRIANVRFFNIRIAREMIGCAQEMTSSIQNGDEVYNTLFVSPPGVGKTTYLRDCIRLLSEGGKKVCVIDERSEIAACHLGVPQNDMGRRTDVLDSCPKAAGMMMALRSMSPEVIAVDELGGETDFAAVEQVLFSGANVIGTIHGKDIKQIAEKPEIKKWVRRKMFQRYILLKKDADGTRSFTVYDEKLEQLC